MNVRTSLAGDSHPDRYHPEARYEFRIHIDGGAREELTYRFAFGATEDGTQPFTVVRLAGSDAGDDRADGSVIARGRTGQSLATDEGGQV